MTLTYKEIQELKEKAEDFATPPEELISLATHEDNQVRISLCRNTKLPREAMDILIYDKDKYVIEALASHQRLTENDCTNLINNAEEMVRFYIAQCVFLPRRCVELLAKDQSVIVRLSLAMGISHLHYDILTQMALYDEAPGVRESAKNNLEEYEKYKRHYKGED